MYYDILIVGFTLVFFYFLMIIWIYKSEHDEKNK